MDLQIALWFDNGRLVPFGGLALSSLVLQFLGFFLVQKRILVSIYLLIAALIFLAGYYSAPIFFTIQRIWIVLGRCLFFKICSHIFMIFEVKLE